MGLEKKIITAKSDFLQLCRQYARLGDYVRVAAEAVERGDMQRHKEASEAYGKQFKEIGEQLKILGASLDAFGGPSVMNEPLPNRQSPRDN